MVNTSALDGVEYHDEFFSISLNKSQISRERFGLIVFIFINAMSDQVVYSVVCLQSRYPEMLYVWRDFKLYQFYLMLFVWLFWGSLFLVALSPARKEYAQIKTSPLILPWPLLQTLSLCSTPTTFEQRVSLCHTSFVSGPRFYSFIGRDASVTTSKGYKRSPYETHYL